MLIVGLGQYGGNCPPRLWKRTRSLSTATPSLRTAERFTGTCTSLNLERKRSILTEGEGINAVDKAKALAGPVLDRLLGT